MCISYHVILNFIGSCNLKCGYCVHTLNIKRLDKYFVIQT